MRILHLIPFLWSGAGDVVTRLAASQAATHDVVVATSGRSRGFSDWPQYRSRLAHAGVRIVGADLFDRAPEVFWSSCAAIGDVVAQWQPHLLHAHAGVPACAAVVASRATSRVPVVAHFYNWGPGRPAWMDRMDIAGLRGADAVVCSAQHYTRFLAQRGVAPSRLHLVPWGLDDRWLETPAVRRRRSGRPPVIGFTGRLEPRKRQLDLVHALAALRRLVPDARLELVGPTADAAYGEAVVSAISEHGLEDAVVLRGHVRDVRPRLRRWDVFVSLSIDEGQGMAVLEAMACGVPVVATAAPGVEDVIDDRRTGLIADSTSPREVARVVARCLQDGPTRDAIATAAWRRVRRDYRWSRTLRKISAVYRQARQRPAAD